MNAFERMHAHLSQDTKVVDLVDELVNEVLDAIDGYEDFEVVDLDYPRLAREAAVRYVRDVFKNSGA